MEEASTTLCKPVVDISERSADTRFNQQIISALADPVKEILSQAQESALDVTVPTNQIILLNSESEKRHNREIEYILADESLDILKKVELIERINVNHDRIQDKVADRVIRVQTAQIKNHVLLIIGISSSFAIATYFAVSSPQGRRMIRKGLSRIFRLFRR